MKYAVRCCCEPTKLYGYIELPGPPRKYGSDGLVMERIRLAMPSLREIADNQPVPVPNAKRHPVKLMRVRGQGLDEVAVCSDDRPIEFWRNIVGFEEVVPAGGIEPPTDATYEAAALPLSYAGERK